MNKYIVKRLLFSVLTLISVISCVFFLLRILPGNPAALILGDYATPEAIAEMEKQLGLDKPIYVQFGYFIYNILHLNFGTSILSNQPVFQEIANVLPFTIYLAIAAIIISSFLGVFAGIVSAKYRDTYIDQITRVISLIGISMPNFWIGILLMLFFSLRFRIFPAIGGGYLNDIGSILFHLVLPATALGLAVAALTARMTRSSMLEVLNQDYIRTAHSKGLKESTVIWKHALRNALNPIITVIGLNAGRLLGGAVVIEVVFSRPGLGKLLVDSIFARDYPVVEGVITTIATIFIMINIFVDIAYVVIDPRIYYGKK